MNEFDIADRVFGVLEKQLGSEVAILPEMSLTDDLEIDSMDLVGIIMGLEREFSIKIGDDREFSPTLLAMQYPDEWFILKRRRWYAPWQNRGDITARGLGEIKEAMPFIDFSGVQVGDNIFTLDRLITVRSLIDYIELRVTPELAAA